MTQQDSLPKRQTSWWPFKRKTTKKTKDGFEIADWAWEGAFEEEFTIDRNAYIKEFEPEEKGAYDGAALNPPSEAEAPSEFENDLKDAIDADMQRQIGKRLSALGRKEAELEKTTIDNPELEIRKIKEDLTGIEIPRIVDEAQPGLLEKKIAAGYAERSYQLFKTRHRRLEEPSEGRKIQFIIIIVGLMILAEGFVNLWFFRGSLETGALGAGVITFSVAAVNVAVGMLAGHTLGKATHYIPKFWVRKTLGWIGSILFFLAITSLHLGFGVYRNIVDENQSTDGAAGELMPRIQTILSEGNWLALFAGEGTLLAVVGIAFAAIAFYEGMLDEFPQLAYMQPIEEALLYLAGYGVRFWFFVQDLSQLQLHYPKTWRTFMANTGTQCFYGVSDIQTANLVSEMGGTATVVNRSFGANINQSDTHGGSESTTTGRSGGTSSGPGGGGSNSGWSNSKTVGTSWSHTEGSGQSTNAAFVGRRIIMPDEVMRMHDEEQVIFMKGVAPIRAMKPPFYADEDSLAKTKIKPPFDVSFD